MQKQLYILFIGLIFFCRGYTQSNEITPLSLTDNIKEAIELRKAAEYYDALDLLFAVINEIDEPENNEERILKAKANNEVGRIFYETGFYDDALDYNQRAISLVEKFDDNRTAYYYHVRGVRYFQKLEALIDINKFDKKLAQKGRESFLKAIELYKKIDSSKNLSQLYRAVANTYIQEKKLDSAEEWVFKARKEALSKLDKDGVNDSEALLVMIYKDNEEYQKAIAIGEKLLDTFKNDSISRREYQIDINLSRAYEGIGNIEKAYEHLRRYNDDKYSSSIENQSPFEKINNQRLRAKAKDLEKREQIADKEVKKVRKFNIALLFSLASLGLITFFFSRSQRLKEQNLQLQLKQKEQEAELNTINAMMDGRETERQDIGQYLHDHVSALVNTANIQLEVLANEANLQENKKLNTTQAILDDIADKVRSLSHQLLSNVLHKYGLAVAFDDLCTNLTGSVIKFQSHSTLPEGKRYRDNIENKLYSVVQELCNNILKHSQATEANIYLDETDTHLHLKITDNGIGISKENIKKGGVGLHQVKARIASMGGTVKIFEGKPTTIKISIPLGIANLH